MSKFYIHTRIYTCVQTLSYYFIFIILPSTIVFFVQQQSQQYKKFEDLKNLFK